MEYYLPISVLIDTCDRADEEGRDLSVVEMLLLASVRAVSAAEVAKHNTPTPGEKHGQTQTGH